MEKIKIKGLALCAGRMFFVWGCLVSLKGLFDVFIGEPESNIYSPNKWDFVSRSQWLTWSVFEVTYGLTCIAMYVLIKLYSKRLPEYIERQPTKAEFL